MLPVSMSLFLMLMIVPTIMAGALGLLVGVAAASILRTNYRAYVVDAALGAAGFVAAFVSVLAIPWRGEYESNGWTIRNQVPHPMVWAYAFAAFLPLVHEIYRRCATGHRTPRPS